MLKTANTFIFLFLTVFGNNDFLFSNKPKPGAIKPTPAQYIDNPQPKGDFLKLTIPLKRAENLLMIEATINGISGNFILDTGAPYLVLNRTYFRDGFPVIDQQAAGIAGTGGEVLRTTVKKLEVQDLYYENVDADIANLAQIENSKGVKVLGLMGTNLFLQFEMIIDARNDILHLYKLNKQGERLLTDSIKGLLQPDLKIPFTLTNNIIFINAKVKEKPLRFCFDTGAEVNVLSTQVNKKILEAFAIQRRSVISGVGGQRAEVLSGIVKEITIGAKPFNNMQTYLTSISSLQNAYNTFFDGIVGYPLMFTGIVTVNFKKKEFTMYLYKN